MKTKTKILAMAEIAIVLCSAFLVALPAIAAEQTSQEVSTSEVTTASEDDYVLGVYGNANEDDTIDMGDVVYVKLAIFGKKPKTELCDAKYDGRINVLDVIQTKLIILGKEKEITVIDSADIIVTVKKPVERVVACWPRGILELTRTVKLEKDRVVGVESWCQKGSYKIFFPEYQDKPVASRKDTESILKLDPDLVLVLSLSDPDPYRKKLESAGVTVFSAYGGVLGADAGEEAIKFGYLFDKKEEAEEFRDWYESITNSIKERVEKIPEEDKPKVYYEYQYGTQKYKTSSESGARIHLAGGKNIFLDVQGGFIAVDPEEVVARNPDIIVKGCMDSGGYELDAGDTSYLEEVRDEIMSRSELQIVTAVREKQVYILSGYLIYGGPNAGCRGFLQTAYMAKWFHPELFEDLDPQAIHQEYLERFQGLDIDLDEKGVFVYHPELYPDGR